MSPELEYRGLRYATHTEVYAPHDDTWLLVDAVHELGSLAGKTVVEVGCGAGLGLIAALKRGARGVGVDRNAAAVLLARENARSNDVEGRAVFLVGDLLGPVDLARVDLVLFNPPYLPTEPHERLPGELNLAFDGGPSGNETLLRFADAMVEQHAARRPVPDVLLVTSSLNERSEIRHRLGKAGLDQVTPLGTRAFSFERLFAEWFQPAHE